MEYPIQTSNRQARKYVQNLQEFKGSNTFSENINGVYAVYSHGHHFPLFIHVNGVWYGNSDRRSKSTSCHYNQLAPCEIKDHLRNTKELQAMILKGGKR